MGWGAVLCVCVCVCVCVKKVSVIWWNNECSKSMNVLFYLHALLCSRTVQVNGLLSFLTLDNSGRAWGRLIINVVGSG